MGATFLGYSLPVRFGFIQRLRSPCRLIAARFRVQVTAPNRIFDPHNITGTSIDIADGVDKYL